MSNENKQNDERAASVTGGMTLAERIAHVGGRENAAGYIEFGSVMAVDALIQHALRDATRATQQATTGDERADALQDMAFVNGVQTGYKFGLVEDHAAYEKCIASRDGYLKVLRETRATPSPVAGSAGQAPTNEELLALHDTEWAKFRKGDSHEPPFRVRFARAVLDIYAATAPSLATDAGAVLTYEEWACTYADQISDPVARRSAWDAAHSAQVQKRNAPDPHSDDLAVEAFAASMKEKLAQARAKGRGGWEQCDPAVLSNMLREHVEKGDPRDVANFCAFLWNLNQPIT